MAHNKYTEEQKAAVLARASEIGITAAAKEAGIDRSTVSRWNKAAAQTQGEAHDKEQAAAAPEEQAVTADETFVEKIEDAAEECAAEMTEDAATEEKTTADTCGTRDAGRKAAGILDAKNVIQEKVGDAVAVAQVEIKKAAGKATKAVKDTTEKVRKTVRDTAKKSVKKVRAVRLDMIFETNDGRQISSDAIAEKVPKGADTAYIKLDDNKIYWVKGEETGSVEIW